MLYIIIWNGRKGSLNLIKDFELNFTHRDGKELISFSKIEADNLVELMAQFLLIIANVQRDIAKRIGVSDDDIPF